MLVASIGFRAQPHKRSEILSAVDETVVHMRRADGCARCRLLVDAEDANTFVMVSEWQSIAQADTYFNSRDFQIFRGIRILFRDEPVMTDAQQRPAGDVADAGCLDDDRRGPTGREAAIPVQYGWRDETVFGRSPRHHRRHPGACRQIELADANRAEES